MPIRLKYSSLGCISTPLDLSSFRSDFFLRERPVLLPRGQFSNLPAISKWFDQPVSHAPPLLNKAYFSQYRDTIVQVEATTASRAPDETHSFNRTPAPLGLFTDWLSSSTRAQSSGPGNTRLYIAQSGLDSLPGALRDDVPVPELVRLVGKGDVYASSLWMGVAPTRTPLHRDPNPNLFVQLVGVKRIRMMAPAIGDAVFAVMAKGGGRVRGEEMMVGEEADVLRRIVWEDAVEAGDGEEAVMVEAAVESGDGVFVPKGWWHAVDGVGEGINASVNWWFR